MDWGYWICVGFFVFLIAKIVVSNALYIYWSYKYGYDEPVYLSRDDEIVSGPDGIPTTRRAARIFHPEDPLIH